METENLKKQVMKLNGDTWATAENEALYGILHSLHNCYYTEFIYEHWMTQMRSEADIQNQMY